MRRRVRLALRSESPDTDGAVDVADCDMSPATSERSAMALNGDGETLGNETQAKRRWHRLH
eukprot:9654789-Alexandrium_andersonii.AAC.1